MFFYVGYLKHIIASSAVSNFMLQRSFSLETMQEANGGMRHPTQCKGKIM